MRIPYIKTIIKIFKEFNIDELEIENFCKFFSYLKISKNSSYSPPKEIWSKLKLSGIKADKIVRQKILEEKQPEKNLEYFVISQEIGTFMYNSNNKTEKIFCELKKAMILAKNSAFAYSYSKKCNTELKLDYIQTENKRFSDFDNVEILEVLVQEEDQIDFGKKLLKVRIIR